MKWPIFILVILGWLILPGCKDGSNNATTEAGDNLNITSSPTSPQFGQLVTLTAVSSRAFTSYQWTVSTPSNVTIGGNASSLQLLLQEIGTYQIQLAATDSNGLTLTASQTITSGVMTTTNTVTLHLIADLFQAGSKVATIANDASAEGDPIVELGPISLDFSRSYSSDSTQPFSSFTFQVDWGAGPMTVTNPASQTFNASHAYPVSLRMTDAGGHTVVQVFTLYVKCPPSSSQSPALAVTLDPSAVSTTSGTSPALNGVFYYSPNTISGGVSPYYVRWDFDGDGVLDTAWLPADTKPLEAYSHWLGPRKLTMQAMDSCFNTVSDTETVTLPIADSSYLVPPNSDLATTGPNYFYVDTQVVSTDPTNLAHNGHFLGSRDRQHGTTGQFFGVSYGKNGWGTDPNHYRVGNTASITLFAGDYSTWPFAGLPVNSDHGLTLTIQNIPDQFGANLTPTMGGAGAKLGWSEFTDDIRGYAATTNSGYGFDADNPCSVSNVQVLLLTPVGSTTCDELDATQNLTYSVRVSGNFQCTGLRSGAFPDAISLENGSFFAEADNVTACGPLPPYCKPGTTCYVTPH